MFAAGSSILSFILARRSLNLNPFSGASWRCWSLPRLTCLGVYVTSWAFVYSSGILILGVGMSLSNATCSLGIFSCICSSPPSSDLSASLVPDSETDRLYFAPVRRPVFYATSKVLICAFFVRSRDAACVEGSDPPLLRLNSAPRPVPYRKGPSSFYQSVHLLNTKPSY